MIQPDMIDSYDKQTQNLLKDLWSSILQHLWKSIDSKKIISFLSKAAVVAIDQETKTIYIGVPNDFVLIQVKKFFSDALQEAVQSVYNNQFGVVMMIYTDLQDTKHPLLVDSKLVLNIKEKVTKKDISPAMKNTLSQYFGILFDPNYTFDTFVVGEHNRFAFSAAKAAAQEPGNAYNPLFLYGNVWLGKTHLMQSVGNTIIQADPTKVVLYLPVGKLIDEIVFAIKGNKLQNLIKKFDDVDALLIDDIQFLANKEKTQEIFHNIFNDFHMKKKQVVLSSDRPPKELINIEPRLKSRFGLWLVADIQAPDYETRLAIAHAKLDIKDEKIDDNLLWIIVSHIKDNVRELEWAINILLTRKKLQGTVTEHDVNNCLQTLGYMIPKHSGISVDNANAQNTNSVKNFSDLVDMVAAYYDIAVADIKGESRKKEISTARQILMLLAKKHFGWTLEKIGDFFGGKNHATVIYAIDNITKKCKTDATICHDYNIFTEWMER